MQIDANAGLILGLEGEVELDFNYGMYIDFFEGVEGKFEEFKDICDD
jgi:hypothetical protein